MNERPVFIGNVATPQLGEVWVALSAQGLIAVEFSIARADFETTLRKLTHGPIALVDDNASDVKAAVREIAEYLQGERRVFELPIDWSMLASDFQRAALRAVLAIPYGETRTYGQVAAQIGHPGASRAMGRANATNPMPLVIPCHRVVGSDGKLHGYGGAGGLKTKEWLLRLENPRWTASRSNALSALERVASTV